MKENTQKTFVQNNNLPSNISNIEKIGHPFPQFRIMDIDQRGPIDDLGKQSAEYETDYYYLDESMIDGFHSGRVIQIESFDYGNGEERDEYDEDTDSEIDYPATPDSHSYDDCFGGDKDSSDQSNSSCDDEDW